MAITITDNGRGFIFVYNTPINLKIFKFTIFSWLIYREFTNNGDYHLPLESKSNIIVLFNIYL